MALEFVHETLAQRVLFGTGSARAHLAAEVSRRGSERVMLIASRRESGVADELAAGLPIAVTWRDVAQHVPIENARRARRAADEAEVDLIVCIGGGSTTGLAKAVALESGVPIVAVPTTFAGSEATNVWGLTEDSRKTTGTDIRVLPSAIVYDAALTESLPRELAVASGLNAIAHSVDSLWAPRADPVNRAFATEGLGALADGLAALVSGTPEGERAGREQTLYGAYLAAVAFTSAGSGLHHKICHVLGGRFGLPHAQTHAVVLPQVLAFNAPAAPAAERSIATALGAPGAVEGLGRLYAQLDAPTALRDLGLAEGDIAEAARLIEPQVPASNPRTVTVGDLENILHSAWAGTRPADA